ncbi:MAG: RNA 2',3'-cyclic phosphodiesterase [Nitrososphaerales archaeon]
MFLSTFVNSILSLAAAEKAEEEQEFENSFLGWITGMRAFLSYDIDDQAFLGTVREIQRELVSTGADLKLVNPKILHFTIRFLGEIDETDKAQIISALKGNVEDFEVGVSFKGLGTFPDERRISVVWVGIDQGKQLEQQALTVNNLLKSINTLRKVDDEKFSPHVTIARVRSGRNKEKLVDFVRERKNQELGVVKIRHLRLKLSTLTPAGPEYSDLHVFEK